MIAAEPILPEFQGVAHWLTFKESYLELLEWVVSKVCEQTFHSSCHQGKAKIAGIALTAAVKKSVYELLGRPTINMGVTKAVTRRVAEDDTVRRVYNRLCRGFVPL